MAIDREFIVNQVLNDGSTVAHGFVPEATPGYADGARHSWHNEPRAKRLEQARALLVAAGYGPNNPLAFRFLHTSGGDGPRFAPVLQQNWREIAPWVQPTLEGGESAVHYRNLQAGAFDVGWAAWGSIYADAIEHLDLLSSGASANDGRFVSPAYDALLARARATVEPQARKNILTQAEQLALDQSAVAPLFFASGRNLVSPRVTGWEDNAPNVHPLEHFCKKPA